MKTTKPAVILPALVLLLTAAAVQSAEKPAKKEISNTRTASCLVKITADEAVLPLNEFAVDYLLHSSGVAGKAAREVLNLSPDEVPDLFEIEDIYSLYPDSGGIGGGTGGMGIPPGAMPGVSTYGTTTPIRSTTARPTSRSSGGKVARTPTRTATPLPTRSTSRTARTTTSERPPTRPPTRRPLPTVTNPPPSSAEQTILFRLHVDLDEDMIDKPIKPAAEEFMNALIENLRSALRGAFDQYRSKLYNQLNLANEEVVRAEAELVQMQIELSNISDSRDLSRYVIHRDISTLRQKLQSTIMQRASDETLYEATLKRITETQIKRKKLADNDSITKELLSILDVHEGRLKETEKLYTAGNASAADIQDIKEKIIRSRIELAQRREQIINPPGSIVISSLNDELASLATNMALAQQEMKSLEVQLREAIDRLKIVDRYELLSLKADIAKQNLEETLLWQARLGRNIRSIQPPDVTVIGAE